MACGLRDPNPNRGSVDAKCGVGTTTATIGCGALWRASRDRARALPQRDAMVPWRGINPYPTPFS